MARVNIENGAIGDRRLDRLARKLGITKPAALGHMVLLWEESQELMRSVGSTEEIAEWVQAELLPQPGGVVQALGSVGYIKEHPEGWEIVGNWKQIDSRVRHLAGKTKGGEATRLKWAKLQERDSSEPSSEPASEPALTRAMQCNAMQCKASIYPPDSASPPEAPASPDPTDLALATKWAEYAKAESKTAKPKLDEWCDAVRLLRRDGFSIEELEAMLAFAREDAEFWKDKATSLTGLRTRSKKNGLLKAENLRNSMLAAQRLQHRPASAPAAKPQKARPQVALDLEQLKRDVDGP